jgi:hypothetical protein
MSEELALNEASATGFISGDRDAGLTVWGAGLRAGTVMGRS